MFEIKNIADAPSAEINIFGDIGEGWFSEGVIVTGKQVGEQNGQHHTFRECRVRDWET